MTNQTEALDKLRELLPAGTTVRTILRHVSRSGMTRAISPVVVDETGETFDLSYFVARAGIAKVNQRHGGVTMSGCGMDMGFALVYNLSRSVFPNGHECIGAGTEANHYRDACPSNDHANDRERNYSPGRHHNDGGYALRHRWL